MTKLKQLFLLAAAAALPATLFAQGTASIHGHVINPAGMAVPGGQVKLTTDKATKMEQQKFKIVFEVDKNGDFKGADIPPGDYLILVYTDGKTADFQEVTLKASDDKVVNFDMTRKEYVDKMTPEDRKALEEYKKKNAEIVTGNAKVANLNALLKSVRDDLASKTPNFTDDIKKMQDAVASKPDEAILYYNLGAAQVASSDAAVAQAKADHKPWQSDEAILKNYNDGIAAYKKGVELNAASKKPVAVDQAIAWNSVGTAYGKMGKTQEAQEAFENASKINPPGAGMYYGNEAAVLFNSGSTDAAAAAADKAIAADPNKADPYFIRGQALITKATVDKAGKIVAPPGCVEAYQKYLELAPEGKSAASVREILASLGQTVNTKYKAPGKR